MGIYYSEGRVMREMWEDMWFIYKVMAHETEVLSSRILYEARYLGVSNR